ncbi:MAG: 3-oxoacyl-[acyl-carrier-protein] reductase [Candidatus Hydrogenedentes bacterium]|nr:3-oxoacyl-[acyl-carrier-protein] reductase [Candidatus Hydrogenedentota bacterium]
MSEFADKVVLVTGGTRGIGRACAEYFARMGAKVALCGRTAETAETAAAQIGHGAIGVQADIGAPSAVDAMIKTVTDTLGSISILVNNAGITRDGLLMRMKDTDWDSVIATNLSGTFYCCRAAVRGMIKQRYGRIINISSVIGLRGQAGQTNYAAAKAGLIGFTKSIAQELGARNITANVVAPGYIQTDMTAGLSEDVQKGILDRIPAGRLGIGEDIAGVVGFLASGAASYITGAVLPVDGGLAM